MAYFMSIGNKHVAYEKWVSDFMKPGERAELIAALKPYAGDSFDGPVSLEKFRKDFCALTDTDRKEFIKMILDSAKYAQSAVLESEIDAAIQADLDKRKAEVLP